MEIFPVGVHKKPTWIKCVTEGLRYKNQMTGNNRWDGVRKVLDDPYAKWKPNFYEGMSDLCVLQSKHFLDFLINNNIFTRDPMQTNCKKQSRIFLWPGDFLPTFTSLLLFLPALQLLAILEMLRMNSNLPEEAENGPAKKLVFNLMIASAILKAL